MRQLTEVQPDSAPMHDWLALAEVADEIRASVSHVKTLLGQRGGPVEIPYFKHGKRTYVKRSELDRYKTRIEMGGVMRTPRRRGQ